MNLKEQEQPETGKQKMALGPRYIRFAFYRLDPAFRKLDSNVRLQAKEEVLSAIDFFKDKMEILAYSVLATRSDSHFLLWQIAPDLEIFEMFASKLLHTTLAPYLNMTHSLVSIYEGNNALAPQEANYLFVHPLFQTKEWHQLSPGQRQKLTEEYLAAASKVSSVRLHLSQSFGLDDQEMVAAFETETPSDFLRLAETLRETKAGTYTLRDTPAFTCLLRDPKQILDALG